VPSLLLLLLLLAPLLLLLLYIPFEFNVGAAGVLLELVEELEL
jgi:hypothetical protein